MLNGTWYILGRRLEKCKRRCKNYFKDKFLSLGAQQDKAAYFTIILSILEVLLKFICFAFPSNR